MNNRIQNEYTPDVVTPPGVTLREMLDAYGMTNAELADRIGKTQKTIIDMIKHGAPVTPDTAIALEKALGAPASFWNNRERRYRESLARLSERKRLEREVDWLKTMPVRAMINSGWISQCRDKVDQLDEVLRFFGVASSEQWRALWMSPRASYRKSKAFNNKPEASSAWLRVGELQAREIECKPFDKKKFRAVLNEIRLLTYTGPDRFQKKAVSLCMEAGVAVVFIPRIKGAPVYGVTRWLTPKKALIQLSLRGRFEDLLWFTFFHESGHILLHGKKDVFIEGAEVRDDREVEADRFAADFLIPPAAWRRFVTSGRCRSHADVQSFAEKIGISPAIVVGRLQHEKRLPHSHLNGLRRRFIFIEDGS